MIYIKKNDKDEDIMCDVCQDDICEEEDFVDDVVLCDKCNVAVHQSCYGNDLKVFPKGDWFCMRCKYLDEHREMKVSEICCIFCRDLKGIIVKTNLGWAHITCVNWLPDIWFEDEDKSIIGGKIDPERKRLFCYICKNQKKNRGYSI